MQIKRPFRQLVSALHGIAIAHPEPYPRRDGELLGGVALSLDNEPESPALAFAHFHDPRDGGDYFLRRSFKKRRIALHLLPVLDRQLVKAGRTNFNFFLMQFLAVDGNDALSARLSYGLRGDDADRGALRDIFIVSQIPAITGGAQTPQRLAGERRPYLHHV